MTRMTKAPVPTRTLEPSPRKAPTSTRTSAPTPRMISGIAGPKPDAMKSICIGSVVQWSGSAAIFTAAIAVSTLLRTASVGGAKVSRMGPGTIP